MKIKLYYFYNGASYISEADRMEVSTIDFRGEYQGMRVFIQEIEHDVPDCATPSKEELANGMIAVLRQQKAAILAETHAKVSNIDDKIQQLLCIEMKAS
jgi:hypothetical protein